MEFSFQPVVLVFRVVEAKKNVPEKLKFGGPRTATLDRGKFPNDVKPTGFCRGEGRRRKTQIKGLNAGPVVAGTNCRKPEKVHLQIEHKSGEFGNEGCNVDVMQWKGLARSKRSRPFGDEGFNSSTTG